MNSSPSILLVIPSLQVGGAEKVMLFIGKALKEEGYRVDVWPLYPRGILATEASEITGKNYSTDLNRTKLPSMAISMLRLFIRISKSSEKVTVLSSVSGTNIFCCVLKLVFGKKIRLIIREATTIHNYRGGIKLKLAKLFYPAADRIVAVSNETRMDLENTLNIPRKKIDVINNPIDARKAITLSREPLHPPIPTGFKNVLFVGRLKREKGADLLINAFAAGKFKRKTQLILVGDGPELDALRDLVKKNGISDSVIFCGQVDNPFPFFRLADVFVLPSRWEGFVNVLLEAMAIGVPSLIATRCRGGPEEILQNGKYGSLVNINDMQGLTEALENAINNSHAPPSYNLNKYDSEKILKEYKKLIENPRESMY